LGRLALDPNRVGPDIKKGPDLTTSPARLVGDARDMTPTLERIYRAMGHDGPQVKRILELNPTHPLLTGATGGPQAVPGRSSTSTLRAIAIAIHRRDLAAKITARSLARRAPGQPLAWRRPGWFDDCLW
jgi:HSP90 family molecular chaperone